MTGLATALALHRLGIGVRVLERVSGRRRSGAGLGIDRRLLARVTGFSADDLPVVRGCTYDLVAWSDVYAWLEARAERAGIPVESGCQVASVSDAEATANLAGGGTRRGSLVVGADGLRSVVRRAVEPGRSSAAYAGYLLWRGLVLERDLPAGTSLPATGDTIDVLCACGFRLFAYAVPGPDGSTAPGGRRQSFAWYDARSHAALAGPAGWDDGRFETIAPEAIPDGLLRGLAATAREVWPGPWDAAISRAVENRGIFATPIANHLPRRLVSGTVTPMTGAGLHTGLLDTPSLGGAVEHHGPSPRALAAYEAERLGPDRALVRQGLRLGRAYLESIGA